jgi:hypothetical protein
VTKEVASGFELIKTWGSTVLSNRITPSALSSEKVSDLLVRLQRYPQLYKHMAALLDEVEKRAGTLNTGAEAEDAIVQRIRQPGRQALGQCAEQSVNTREELPHLCSFRSDPPSHERKWAGYFDLVRRPPSGVRRGDSAGKEAGLALFLHTVGVALDVYHGGAVQDAVESGGGHDGVAAIVQTRGCSRRVQRALTDFGADQAFAVAATKVQEHYEVRVPATRVRTVTRHHAQVLAGASTSTRADPAGPRPRAPRGGSQRHKGARRRHERGTPPAPTGANIGGCAIRKRAWSPRRPTARLIPSSVPPCMT